MWDIDDLEEEWKNSDAYFCESELLQFMWDFHKQYEELRDLLNDYYDTNFGYSTCVCPGCYGVYLETNTKEENFVDNISKSQRVGCFGSMNLSYNEKFNIFISDPWSRNKNDNSISSKFVYKAIEQVVNSNNRYQISMSSIIGIVLMIGLPKNFNEVKKIFLSILSFLL